MQQVWGMFGRLVAWTASGAVLFCLMLILRT
jgi:hypothetical protein